MSRRYAASDVSVDRYDDRREYERRPNGRSRGYEDRYFEEDREVDYRSGGRRERDVVVKEEVRVRDRDRERESTRSPPEFLREDYGRSTAGPMVLRAREREEFEYVPRPRRRSPSPEPERRVEKEEIIIRRDESERREPPPLAPVPPRPRPREVEREEIIIRRDEREPERRGPPTREVDREEIIIRRDEREPDRRGPPPREVSRDRDEIIIRRDHDGRQSRYEADFERDDVSSRRGGDRLPPREHDREEIIIRRDQVGDSREPRYTTRGDYDDYTAVARPKSHERERSRPGRGSEDEIIIRRDEREGGRGGDREREEIIIRHHSRSRSPSPAESVRAPPVPKIYAPEIHQEVITHHRHIDHGYELALAPIRSRPISRPPSPPMPPPPAPREEERIEIRQSGVRNGRAYDEDIIIDRNEGPARGALAPRPTPPEPLYDPRQYEAPAPRRPHREYDREVEEEAEYYNNRAISRGYPGEAYHGATRDWGLVDVPPGTNRVRMDGVGGGAQEVTWQRYNGSRRSKFFPDGSDEGYGSGELMRPAGDVGGIGARYGRERDGREGLWTEITKDLVIKEAIIEMKYEFEETEEFYYVFQNLRYEDVARLVGLSDDIKKDRRRRLQQIEWEQRVMPPEEERRERILAIEGPPPRGSPRQEWDIEDERYIEREIVYRGGRPPPGPRWR